MSTPRRRLVRPAATTVAAVSCRRRERLQGHLTAERQTLARWMARLRRAFHAVEKAQRRLARLERLLGRQEG